MTRCEAFGVINLLVPWIDVPPPTLNQNTKKWVTPVAAERI